MSAIITGIAIFVIVVLFAVVIWALFFHSKYPPAPPLNDSACTYNSDCPPSQFCSSGLCTGYCLVDSDCYSGQQYGTATCQFDTNNRKLCVPKSGCTVDTDCNITITSQGQSEVLTIEACAIPLGASTGYCVAIGGVNDDNNPNVPCSATDCYGSSNISCIKPNSQTKLTAITPNLGACTVDSACASGLQCGTPTSGGQPSVNQQCFQLAFTNCPTDHCQPKVSNVNDVGYCASSTRPGTSQTKLD